MQTPWQDHALSGEIETALAAVRQAGSLCRSVRDGLDPGALDKSDRSPVTVADFGSQALVCRLLGEVFPGDPVIGEEDSGLLRAPDGAAMLERVVDHVKAVQPEGDADAVCEWIDRGNAQDFSDRFWTLDPIDGTKGFLRGGQYAVALALVLNGRLEVAVLGCPNLGPSLSGERAAGTAFVAVRGSGAWQTPLLQSGDWERVRVSTENDTTRFRFCESVEAAHSSHGDAARIAERLAIAADPARLDSQTKYGVVARAEAEAYLRLPRDPDYREKIWDHAAGALVVTEAGGRVTDVFGADLDFTRGHELGGNRGVIVTNGQGHDAVLAVCEELGVGRF